MERLIAERKSEELLTAIVSQRLTYEEAAQYADISPLMKHWEGYPQETMGFYGAMIIEADVNQDGSKDFIEYVPAMGASFSGGTGIEQNSLTIYLGEARM